MDMTGRLAEARAWATRSLEWAGKGGVRLEPTRALVLLDRRTGRPVWEVQLAVWEPAGAAVVRLGPRVVVELDGGDEAPPEAGEPLEPDDRRLADAVTVALAEARARERLRLPEGGRPGRWGVRGVTGWLVRGEVEARVELERRAAEDGTVSARFDGQTEERLALHCPLLLRGSRRSTAIGRSAAVTRARAWLERLGEMDGGRRDARLLRGRLDTSDGTRTWRLRFRLPTSDGPPRELTLILNSRTGAVSQVKYRCAWRAERSCEQVTKDLALLARVRLGPGTSVGSVIEGEQEGRRVWLGVVHAADGKVYRATVQKGSVRFQKIREGA